MLSKQSIEAALLEHWNLQPAAAALGIGYSTLKKYIKDFGITHNSRKSRPGTEYNRNKQQAIKLSELRRARKKSLLEYKGGVKCSRCSFDEPIPDCYAFHHRDPTDKHPDWIKLFSNNHSMEELKKEVDKCDVLCHNCHSIVHYKLRQ